MVSRDEVPLPRLAVLEEASAKDKGKGNKIGIKVSLQHGTKAGQCLGLVEMKVRDEDKGKIGM